MNPTEIITGKGIVLVGEAANSWVDLQWTKFIVHLVGGLGLVVAAIICIVWFLKTHVSED